ncbi:MAG: NAD(P)/FAD-dependent oxidoreductase [Cyanobacteria bacterium]|nr:NAD(P)/FAD-dependent oxidoreductase [Cyanobacteriota bacterium]
MKNLWRKDTIYDVAVIGAGPAGASLAYFLSDFNLKVILIEKKKFADTPVRCAELVPRAITQLYNDKISGIDNEINYMETYIEGKLANTIKSPGLMLDRNIFVNFLIQKFVKKGGVYLNSACFLNPGYGNYPNQNKVIGLNRDFKKQSGEISLTKNQAIKISIYHKDSKEVISLKTKILVGADGPNSIVAKIMDSFFDSDNKIQKKAPSDKCYIAGFQENLAKQTDCENNTRIFFYPYLTCGYGWLFPKKSSMNVGVAISMEAVKRNGLKNTYLRFKDELLKNSVISGNEKQNSTISGLAPVSGISTELVKGNIMLIGDAAGLCNPITGAGNFNAAVSAKIASGYIKKALSSGDFNILREINNEFNNYFKTSLVRAKEKRKILENNWLKEDFTSLIRKTWVSFKDYWYVR